VKRRQDALDRFQRATELPLLVLAVTMIPLLLAPLMVDLPAAVESAFVAVDWFIWAAFAFDYVVRLALSPDRKRYVRHEWPNLLIVALPFLRPLRIIRSARALRILRLSRLSAVLGEVGQEGKRLLVRHHLHYALLIIVIVVLGSASLGLLVEEGHGGPIESFGDALWWATTTVTTVGYGDTFPTTPAGRGIAVFLMVAGITLFGLLTANIAALFVERASEDAEQEDERRDADMMAVLAELLARMEALEVALAHANRTDGRPIADKGSAPP
jgi:voltage-gated potassium channel